MTGRRSSRWIGVLVLGVALIATLAAPVGWEVSLGDGASRADLPEPPAVGSCLVVVIGVSTVPCADLHEAEVVTAWRADASVVDDVARFSGYLERPFAGLDRSMGGVTEEVVNGCWGAVMTAVRPEYDARDEPARWLPVPPAVQAALIAAPPGQGSGRWRWLSCVAVSAFEQPWSGLLNGPVGRPTVRPAVLAATCGTDVSLTLVRCDRQHRSEVLGWPADGTAVETADLAGTCFELAQQLIGADDPTFAGRVAVTVLTDAPFLHTSALPACTAEVIGDELLVGSLVGLGDAALPLE